MTSRRRLGLAPSPSQAYELRSVAAPFGNCIEPSNVKAGGDACPIRFQCSGCGFYRADPFYIPAIQDHFQALRADRGVATAMGVDDFVLRNLTDQITALPERSRQHADHAGRLRRRSARRGRAGRARCSAKCGQGPAAASCQ